MGNLFAHHCQETMLIKWLFRLELAQVTSSGFREPAYFCKALTGWLAYSPKAYSEPPRSFIGSGAAPLGWVGEGEGTDDTSGLGHTPTSQEDLIIQTQDYSTSAHDRPGIHLNICFHASTIQCIVQGM